MVRGIDNIGIYASNLARSVAFYETRGFSEAYRNHRGVMLGWGQRSSFCSRRISAMHH
jgi:catechol 2,3-dioxygenase-like lactoylglutathione lyase family enzyme